MSFFSSRQVCDQVKFYSINIDPTDAGQEGKLTIANGNLPSINVPAEMYSFIVDSSDNLSITAQSGGPAPLIECLTLNPNGTLNMNANKITNVAAPTLSTDVATKQYVDNAVSGGGGGGGGSLFPGLPVYTSITSSFDYLGQNRLLIITNTGVGNRLALDPSYGGTVGGNWVMFMNNPQASTQPYTIIDQYSNVLDTIPANDCTVHFYLFTGISQSPGAPMWQKCY